MKSGVFPALENLANAGISVSPRRLFVLVTSVWMSFMIEYMKESSRGGGCGPSGRLARHISRRLDFVPHCRSTVVCKAQASQGAKVVKNISQQAAVLAASTLIAGVRVADHSEGFTLPMD